MPKVDKKSDLDEEFDEYERARQDTIRENQLLLASLGLDAVKAVKKAPVPRIKKPTTPVSSPRQSLRHTPSLDDNAEAGNSRRSSRLSTRETPNYSHFHLKHRTTNGDYSRHNNPGSMKDFIVQDKAMKREKGEYWDMEGGLGKGAAQGRIHDPKTIGAIPGVAVGTCWPFRSGASRAAIHGCVKVAHFAVDCFLANFS